MKFFDRDNDRPQLAEAIINGQVINPDESKDNITAVIVYSLEGYGKTALIEHVADNIDLDLIVVQPPNHHARNLLAPGCYFDSLFAAFSNHYPSYSFKQKKGIGIEWSFGASIGISPAINVGFTPKSKSYSDGIIRRNKVDSIVSYCLNNNIKPAFHFENCNLVDTESLNLIITMLANIEKAICIFEYTLYHGSDNMPNVVNFKRDLSQSVDVSMMSLDQLDLSNAIAIIADKNKCISLSNKEMSELYTKSAGNLWVFEELCEEHAISNRFSSIERSMFKQPDLDYILSILALFQRPISIATIREVSKFAPLINMSEKNAEKICEYLVELKRIEKSTNECFALTEHEDIDAILSGPSAYAAYSAFIAYQSKETRNLSIEDIYILLDAQCRFNDSAMFQAFEKIKPVICASKPDGHFCDFAVDLVMRLSIQMGTHSRYVYRAILTIFSIYYSAADYKGALHFLDMVDQQNYFQLCRFMAQATMPDAENMKSKYEILLKEYSLNDRLLMLIASTYMSYLMRTASKEDCLNFCDSVLSNKDNSGYPEFWWMKKLRSQFESNDLAVANLSEVADKLETLGFRDMRSRVEITLATKLLFIGKPEQAATILKQGEQNCYETYCRPAVYYNNIAACNFVRGECGLADLKLFDRALSYSLTPYERLFVASNALALSILLNQTNSINRYFRIVKQDAESGYSGADFLYLRASSLLCYSMWSHDIESATSSIRDLGFIMEVASPEMRASISRQIEIYASHKSCSSEFIRAGGYKPGFIGYWQTTFEEEYIELIMAHYDAVSTNDSSI